MSDKNVFAFRPARRSNAKPLIGLYSESGCGKTYTALSLARGFVGPHGRIGMIETESGRGEAYSDPNEYPEFRGADPDSNYNVLPLHGDFSPSVYGTAIDSAERQKFDALIIDSASHEWEGAGGVLSMAADNEAKGAKGQLVWQKPKIEHQRNFMLRFMQTAIPLVILCMRAKYPMVQAVVNGKREWARSQTLEPKQSDDILFEMFVHGWIGADHKFHRTKSTAKALEPVFLDNEPITLETGRKLAAWASGDRNEDRYGLMLRAAEDAAERGLANLREHWKVLSKEDRAMLKSQNERLAGIAKKADEGERDHILDEEGFGDAPVTTPDDIKELLAVKIAALSDISSNKDLDALNAEVRPLFVKYPSELGEWNAAYLERKREIAKLKTAAE